LKQSRFATFEGNLYSNDDIMLAGDDDENGDGGPCKTPKETNTYGTENCVLLFPDNESPDMIKNNALCSVFLPLLKETTQILEGNCSDEKLSQCKEMLSKSKAKGKKEFI
jgi:hypothetical protein